MFQCILFVHYIFPDVDIFKLRKNSITVGNAMGYIRLIRSGGIHSCSNASIFLTVNDRTLQFDFACENGFLPNGTQISANNLEIEIKDLQQNYAESTEYFRVIQKFSEFDCQN